MDYDELSRIINRANRAWQHFRFSEQLANEANFAAKRAVADYWLDRDRAEYNAFIERGPEAAPPEPETEEWEMDLHDEADDYRDQVELEELRLRIEMLENRIVTLSHEVA